MEQFGPTLVYLFNQAQAGKQPAAYLPLFALYSSFMLSSSTCVLLAARAGGLKIGSKGNKIAVLGTVSFILGLYGVVRVNQLSKELRITPEMLRSSRKN